MPSRADAYRAALAKTAGRQFDGAGELILTDYERSILKGAEDQDFRDEFRKEAGRVGLVWRLAAVFRGE